MEFLGSVWRWFSDPTHWSGADGIPQRLVEHVQLSAESVAIGALIALPIGAVFCAVASAPISWLVFRLRGGYFAIGTWAVADVLFLLTIRDSSLGGGTGTGLPGLALIDPTFRQALTYWAALAVAAAALLTTYLLLSSRMGLDLTAIRDNELAARSVGVRVTLAQRLVYVVSAGGCGAAGAILIISQLNVLASAVFSVSWSAKMIFIALIGGLGSIEGPIVGTAVYTIIQQALAQFGAWYLILLGAVAVIVAMYLPRGIWGVIGDRLHLQVFPTGYWLHR